MLCDFLYHPGNVIYFSIVTLIFLIEDFVVQFYLLSTLSNLLFKLDSTMTKNILV